MILPPYFISCDWGTSNFRLRLVETETCRVKTERRTSVGVKKHFQYFEKQSSASREAYFATYLEQEINQLDDSAEGFPVIASGMLSSSIGMKGLPYAKMPLGFGGKELICETVRISTKTRVLLVSGMRSQNDVMRGEETQAIGLSRLLPKKGRGILLLPGTHSKHITFEKGHFEDFTTYMTGELFEIISQHSILSASLNPVDFNNSYREIFLNGVGDGIAHRQMSSLFSIRANSLLGHISGQQNFYYLSGLLIGGELAYLKDFKETIYLAANGVHLALYELALNNFLSMEQIVCFKEQDLENALLSGHKQILQIYG